MPVRLFISSKAQRIGKGKEQIIYFSYLLIVFLTSKSTVWKLFGYVYASDIWRNYWKLTVTLAKMSVDMFLRFRK
jgi:hypothetical protein